MSPIKQLITAPYPAMLARKPMTSAIDVEIGPISLVCQLPSSGDILLKGTIRRVGKLKNGDPAFDFHDDGENYRRTIPIASVQGWAATATWCPDRPTRPGPQGFCFILHDAVNAASVQNEAGTWCFKTTRAGHRAPAA